MPSHRRRRETPNVLATPAFPEGYRRHHPACARATPGRCLGVTGVAAPGIRRNGAANADPAMTRTGS